MLALLAIVEVPEQLPPSKRSYIDLTFGTSSSSKRRANKSAFVVTSLEPTDAT